MTGDRKPLVVRLGEHHRSPDLMDCDQKGLCEVTVQERNVSQVVMHQDFEGASLVKSLLKSQHFFLVYY